MLTLPDDARVVICDVWGCLHDSGRAFPPAMAALARWRGEGRIVVLVTNAPRPGVAIARQLAGLGIAPDSYDALVTSGDAGLAFIADRGPCALIGTEQDRRTLAEAGFMRSSTGDEATVVVTGLDERRPAAADYRAELETMRARGALLACFNPDRVVVHGGAMSVCAGAIADIYTEMGGEVVFTGKPFAPIYDRAFGLASTIAGAALGPRDAVAIGDGIATDLAGAAAQGIRFVFVTGGIERHEVARSGVEAVLATARATHALDDFTPHAVIDAIR